MKTIIDFRNRLRSILFIVLCLTLLNIKFAAAQNTEILEAKHLVEVDQTKKAIEVLTKAIQTYPAVPSLHYYLGMAQLGSGTRDVALKTFEKGISVDDKEPLNYVGRGRLSMLENNAQKAKLDFDKALTLSKSKNVAVLQGVADAYMIDPKRSNDAMNLLNKAKAIDDHDAETLILLGDAFLQQNNGGQAVTNYERAASLNPKLAKPHYKIGLVYLRSRNYPAAQEAFNKAIALDPGYTLAYKEIGENYYSQKEATKAVAAYEKYMALTENPEPAKLRMAFFYFMAKDYPKANTMFETLLTKPDASITAKRFYAQSLYKSGNLEKSRTMFDEYFAKAKPEDIDASDWGAYGHLLVDLKLDSIAVDAFQKSLALEPKQPDLLREQAKIYFDLKKYPESASAYEKLRALNIKWTSNDLYTVGRVYWINSEKFKAAGDTATQRQQLLKADTAFQKLIEVQANTTVPYKWAAQVKASLDPESEKGLAKPYYEKLIEKALPTADKNKADLILAYSYLGYYHFLKNELAVSKTNWEKLLAIDPGNVQATTALQELKKR